MRLKGERFPGHPDILIACETCEMAGSGERPLALFGEFT